MSKAQSMLARDRPAWPTLVVRGGVFGLLWWVLTGGEIGSWMIGAPTVLLATLASAALIPVAPWSVSGLLRFIPFFIWHSLKGGVDVAWRSLHPRLPIAPDLVEYSLHLPPGLPRVFMANTLSLLPGTLSAELDDARLCVHVLDGRGSFPLVLEALEKRVADLFGLTLDPSTRGR